MSTEVGSNDETDFVDEDLLRDQDSLATGFVGRSSEVQWLLRLRQQTERHGSLPGFEGPYGPPSDGPEATSRRIEASKQRKQQQSSSPIRVSTSTFYLDIENIDVDYGVNPFELPPVETAQRLFDRYMNTVHDSFPILSKGDFTSQVRQYYTSLSQGTPSAMPEKWLAILNLVFAIGAKYSHLIQTDWLADSPDHLIYHSRAQILGLGGLSLVSQPDLMQIQITALLAFYFLGVGRVNR